MSAHSDKTELKLIGKLILDGEISCQTGLHIGGGKGSLDIGGADNPVVKDAYGMPYIPGSSLRGRLRSLLETASGLAVPEELVYLNRRRGQEVRIHQSSAPGDEICLLFGRNPGRMDKVQGGAVEGGATPARLAVYDAPLDPDSITTQMRENLDDEITEIKSENAIDRITAQSTPRTLERVPAGARFKFRMVLDVLCEEDKVLPARVAEGLRLLEDDAGPFLRYQRGVARQGLLCVRSARNRTRQRTRFRRPASPGQWRRFRIHSLRLERARKESHDGLSR
jgi:CRISPR-associated protein Csm3